MTYRCLGCREYRRGTPFERVGLGSVCSAGCVQLTAERRRQRPRPSVPADGIPPATRTAVLARDGGCRYCGVAVGLHLHHINYRSEGVDHSEHNLITLCARHHELVHSDKGYWQPVLHAYIALLYGEGKKRYLREVARLADRSR